MPGPVVGNGGYRPGGGDDFAGSVVTENLMKQPGRSLTMREALVQGVGKAHRSVVYAHYDFRNFLRSKLGTQGRV